jgi:hypothetical protein
LRVFCLLFSSRAMRSLSVWSVLCKVKFFALVELVESQGSDSTSTLVD